MAPAGVLHSDPGLQPERTVLSWGRTMMLFALVGAVFLRWLPQHGFWTVGLALGSATVAGAIYATQRRRYRRQSHGIAAEQLEADVLAVLITTCATLCLGALGIIAVLS